MTDDEKKARKREINRAWREANREKLRAYKRANAGRILAARAALRARNIERARAADRAFYAANREKSLARRTAWRAANPDKAKATANKSRRKRWADWRAFLDDAKRRPCIDCGRTTIASAMHFDHRPDELKVFSVGSMGRHFPHRLDAILAEIAKCDLVCAVCHAIRTRARGDHRRRSGRHPDFTEPSDMPSPPAHLSREATKDEDR